MVLSLLALQALFLASLLTFLAVFLASSLTSWMVLSLLAL
jgi:hypothetical protein